MFDERFHPADRRDEQIATLTASVNRANVVVTDSDAVLAECRERWPNVSGKFTRIYLGTGPVPKDGQGSAVEPAGQQRPYILTVGTIEPRKNYDAVFTAYEALVNELGDRAPDLVVAGRAGWMSQTTIDRLFTLVHTGRVHWLRDVSDGQLSGLYERAQVFTYLSLYEGFGYPPFEAAYAGTPMVLSSRSSIGEIWRDHACCVDPTDPAEIVRAWQWALSLNEEMRTAVLQRQARRAAEFSWKRCVQSYLDLYEELAHDSRREELA